MTQDAISKERQLVQRLWGLLEPMIEAEGLVLIETEYRREPQGWVLRLYVDRDDGITVEDCAHLSRILGDYLDVADPIPVPYHLEVSSPGLNRPLRKLEHFREQVGNVIDIRTIVPIQNRRNFRGTLLEVASDRVAVDCDGRSYIIELADIDRARLRYFDSVSER